MVPLLMMDEAASNFTTAPGLMVSVVPEPMLIMAPMTYGKSAAIVKSLFVFWMISHPPIPGPEAVLAEGVKTGVSIELSMAPAFNVLLEKLLLVTVRFPARST